MQVPVFNHEGDTATEMLNLTEEDANRIRNLIAFETIKGHLLADELYPDEKAPKALTTKSGCMERCLKNIYNEQEKTLMFMIFNNFHEGIGKIYHLHEGLAKHMTRFKAEVLDDAEDSEINNQLKSLIMKKIENDLTDKLKIVDKVVEVIKETKYDYNTFNSVFTERYGDLTDLLQDALKSMRNRVMRIDRDDEDDED